MFIQNPSSTEKVHGISIDDPKFQHLQHEQPSWKLIIRGPHLAYADRGKANIYAINDCVQDTGKMIMQIAFLSRARNIVEIEFQGTDMLSPKMIATTELRPFVNLQRVHFLNCRQITMRSAANLLASFGQNKPSLEIVFTTKFPEINELNGESWHGAVLCDLFLWRHHQPEKFIKNLLKDTRFRHFIEFYACPRADDWYRFMYRDYPADNDWVQEDWDLMHILNKGRLVKGSNAAAAMTCFQCQLLMPGLCFPKVRRNTDQEECCHGCRVDEIIREQSCEVSREASSVLNSYTFNTIEDFPMQIFDVAADTFPYVKAPFNTKYNTVCPHSLIAKTCKGKCSLRKAYVCCPRLGANC